MFGDFEIRTLPMTLKSASRRVEDFLASCDLRLDPVDYYAVVTRVDDEQILAGGGLSGNVVKCVAVSDELRGTGMMQSLVSHLLSVAHEHGHDEIRVFTKPSNRDIFESLGFKVIAQGPQAIFMENALGGIGDYCNYLRSLRRPGKNGMIVMNANPFTLGHQALVEFGASQVDNLYVIVVKEDCSQFSYESRMAMIASGTQHLDNVVVCQGSDYAISAATFPTYFLKQLNDASETQITLDLDLCARHLAPSLEATVRFVGSEPTDLLTARYVELMQAYLPPRGIDVQVFERVTHDGVAVSASLVRQHLNAGFLSRVTQMVPVTTVPHLISELAHRALLIELETTPKPGLVDREDNGAHSDMTFDTMQRSIDSLRQPMEQLCLMATNHALPETHMVQQLGIDAEAKMLQATGGVNTHRGALFALGLSVVAVTHAWSKSHRVELDDVRQHIIALANGLVSTQNGSHGQQAVTEHRIAGALDMARGGYERLFCDWLNYYDSLAHDPWQCHKTLLRIMSELDDTNVLHRVGYDMAQSVKEQSRQLLEDFSADGLRLMNQHFIAHNISPGGAADMLSLTIFMHSVTN